MRQGATNTDSEFVWVFASFSLLILWLSSGCLGQTWPCRLLHRVRLRSCCIACRSRSSLAHAAVVEYFLVDGESRHHHATSLSHQRDSKKVQETSQLPLGVESHGEELSARNSRRPSTQLRQLCHMLGEDGHSSKAAVFASLPQFVSSVVAWTRHFVSHVSLGAQRSKQCTNATKSSTKHRFRWIGTIDRRWGKRRSSWSGECFGTQQPFFPLQWAGKNRSFSLVPTCWSLFPSSGIFPGCRTLASKFPTSIQCWETGTWQRQSCSRNSKRRSWEAWRGMCRKCSRVIHSTLSSLIFKSLTRSSTQSTIFLKVGCRCRGMSATMKCRRLQGPHKLIRQLVIITSQQMKSPPVPRRLRQAPQINMRSNNTVVQCLVIELICCVTTVLKAKRRQILGEQKQSRLKINSRRVLKIERSCCKDGRNRCW